MSTQYRVSLSYLEKHEAFLALCKLCELFNLPFPVVLSLSSNSLLRCMHWSLSAEDSGWAGSLEISRACSPCPSHVGSSSLFSNILPCKFQPPGLNKILKSISPNSGRLLDSIYLPPFLCYGMETLSRKQGRTIIDTYLVCFSSIVDQYPVLPGVLFLQPIVWIIFLDLVI